jgi:hypothetical protein
MLLPPYLLIFLTLLALLGHTALWTGVFNRLHATPLPCRMISLIEKPLFLIIAAIPAVVLWWWLVAGGQAALGESPASGRLLPLYGYAILCWAIALAVTARWFWWRWTLRTPAALMSNDTTTIDIAQHLGERPLGDLATRLLESFPGNQILQLDVHEKVIALPRVSPTLDGLSIAHLSDLHCTGQLTKSYFDCLIDQTNELDADLVAITGDIIDKASCLEWLPDALGRLTSRYGTYFVLGNHDKRLPDAAALRRALADAGLVDLGGRCMDIGTRGESVLLAGNELPWFAPAPDMRGRPTGQDPVRPLSILLAHTPDQIDWARSFGFDLLLAGHTHGGQIRLPLIGPIVSPSIYGVKYAAGLFYVPPTLMHVSRGISGLQAIRLNCPPELTKLVLRKPAGK